MVKHLHIHGTARSGHHAVIYWLVGCIGEGEGRIHYANQACCGQNPLAIQNVNNEDFPSGLRVKPIAPSMSVSDTDFLISSTEDVPVGEWNLTYHFPGVEAYEGVVIRDPFNQLASRFRLFESMGALWQMDRATFIGGFANLWMGHLDRVLENDPELIFIDYNNWFASEAYRKGICARWGRQCGLTFNDQYLNYVSAHGTGSSFDGREFHRNGQGMEVRARWEKFRDSVEFWDTLASGGAEFLNLLENYYRNASCLQEPIGILRKRLT